MTASIVRMSQLTDPLLRDPLCRDVDLGRPIPDSPHAVSVCLPTWRDNVGYEEEEPRVVERLRNGYPRFVYHQLCRELFELCISRIARNNESALAFPTLGAAERFATFLSTQTDCRPRIHEFGQHDVRAVCFPNQFANQAKAAWQHLGEGVSSRLAEACLQERPAPDDSAVKLALRQRIAAMTGARADDVFLFPCGMTAIYAVYRALSEILPGRKCAQFGFPYVDTLKIQQKCGPGVHFYPRGNRQDLDELAQVLQTESLAGIYTEFPSNPLLCSPDLTRLVELSREHDCPLVVDDTLATFLNADLLPSCDALCSSLTKFFSGVGDVTAGSVVLNSQGRFYADLLAQLHEMDDLLWCEDAIVLEQNSRDFEQRMPRINQNAEKLADFLSDHPRVASVYYPKYQSPENYKPFLREGGGYGGLLSIDLVDAPKHAPAFFDALRVCKGPNLGTNFTLACPFTILAHYNELEFAESCGVSRYLIRVSVGLEDADDLIARFDEALVGLT